MHPVELNEQARRPILSDFSSPAPFLTPSRPRSDMVQEDGDVVLLHTSPARGSGSASILSSIFNLANTIMGSGLLTLPSAFASAGLISGLVLAISCSALNVMTLQFLTLSSRMRTFPTRPNMASVADAALPFWGKLLADAALISFGVGVCIGYMIVATDSLVEITGVHVRPLWTLLTAAIVAPLSLLRNIDSLRFTSTLAILSLGAISIAIVAYSLIPSLDACGGFVAGTVTCHADDPMPHHASPVSTVDVSNASETTTAWPCPGQVNWAVQPPIGLVRALSKFVLAFGCQQNILPIVAELKRPTPPRILFVSVLAIALACTCYIVVATSGYLTFGHSVCSNVLNSYARTPMNAIIRLLITAVVLTSYPLIAFAGRQSLVSRVGMCSREIGRIRQRRSSGEAADKPDGDAAAASSSAGVDGQTGRPSVFVTSLDQRLVASAFILTTTIVALTVSDLGHVLGFVGASSGVLVNLTIPALCYWRIAPKKTAASYASLATLVLSLVFLPLAVVMELE